MNKEKGTTLVLVTHNLDLAQRTQRILRMRGGKLVEEVIVEGAKLHLQR
jgi:putative ABC transport system ATP-binding protein